MKKKLPIIVVGVVVLLIVILGFVFWQKSQVSPGKTILQDTSHSVKKIDMASQPKWVQDLKVTAVKGVHRGERGLDNVKVTIDGIPSGMVSTLTYTMSYSYKTAQGDGSGGFFTDTPVPVNGAPTFTRSFDFGTCSTNSCVRHDGVTSLDVEFDFTTSNGDTPVWSGNVDVK